MAYIINKIFFEIKPYAFIAISELLQCNIPCPIFTNIIYDRLFNARCVTTLAFNITTYNREE